MVIRNKLDEVQAALDELSQCGPTEAEVLAALEQPSRMGRSNLTRPTVLAPLALSHTWAVVDAIWSVRGKHAQAGRIEADLKGERLVITHAYSGNVLYDGDGEGVGIRDDDVFPPRYTLFLDKAGYALEAMAKRLITRAEVEETYFETSKVK